MNEGNPDHLAPVTGARLSPLFPMHPLHKPKYPAGFSLIELLVVVAIIALLGALAMGGLSNVIRSSKLTNTAQRIADQITVARQLASSRNIPVQVRFYGLPYFDMTTGGAFINRGMQLFMTDGITFTNAVSRPFLFPNRVAIRDDSPLLGACLYVPFNSPGLTNFGVYGRGTICYRAFTIRPNGIVTSGNNTVISDYNNWITLQNWDPNAKLSAAVPTNANYVAIQVNPITAKVTILRP